MPFSRFKDDAGVALASVIGITAVLTLLVVTLLSFASGVQRQAHRDQDWHAALAAAEAGVDDYLFRLNRGDAYYQYTTTAGSPDNNPALSGWTPVPGGASRGEFRYAVDASEMTAGGNGTVRLTSTGRVDGVERTVEVTYRRASFLDFLYFTDYETLDPTVHSDPAWAEVNCAHHRYETWKHPVTGVTRTGGPSDCVEINWVTGDTVNGPFHTNDRFLISGNPTWLGAASSSSPNPLYTGTGTPSFPSGSPFRRNRLEMPPTNAAIRRQADYTVGATGCLYTGPTQIVIADDKLQIKSPYTKESGPGCGSFPNDAVQTVDIPTNGVVYVQNIPSAADDPNAQPGYCPKGQGLGYPITDDDSHATVEYSCRNGDAFVEGRLDGRLTIAAQNDIVITWHITRRSSASDSDDILGLVANNFVEVYHPTDGNTNLRAKPLHNAKFVNPTIEAAILSMEHSFIVQKYDKGPTNKELGTLNVTGIIAQKYRGPVGQTNGRGYLKNYVYDERLRYMSPPHFIDPVAGAWAVTTWSEI